MSQLERGGRMSEREIRGPKVEVTRLEGMTVLQAMQEQLVQPQLIEKKQIDERNRCFENFTEGLPKTVFEDIKILALRQSKDDEKIESLIWDAKEGIRHTLYRNGEQLHVNDKTQGYRLVAASSDYSRMVIEVADVYRTGRSEPLFISGTEARYPNEGREHWQFHQNVTDPELNSVVLSRSIRGVTYLTRHNMIEDENDDRTLIVNGEYSDITVRSMGLNTIWRGWDERNKLAVSFLNEVPLIRGSVTQIGSSVSGDNFIISGYEHKKVGKLRKKIVGVPIIIFGGRQGITSMREFEGEGFGFFGTIYSSKQKNILAQAVKMHDDSDRMKMFAVSEGVVRELSEDFLAVDECQVYDDSLVFRVHTDTGQKQFKIS